MKTICIRSDLSKSAVLRYRPLGREFQTNNWYIKINSIAAVSSESALFNDTVTLTCNFVTSETYKNSSIVSYEQPLQMFQLKVQANDKSTIRFNDQFWYKINSSSSELQFSLLDFNDVLIQKKLNVKLSFSIAQR